jgi:hypothetical protein
MHHGGFFLLLTIGPSLSNLLFLFCLFCFSVTNINSTSNTKGRHAILQVTTRPHLTPETRIQSKATPHGICGGQSSTGADSSEYFGFNLIIIIPQLIHTYVSSGTGIIGPFDGAVPT